MTTRLIVVVTVLASLMPDFVCASQLIEGIKANKPLDIITSGDVDDLDEVDENGFTAIHIAIICERIDIIEWLASRGANLLATEPSGLTPFQIALRIKYTPAIRMLILLVPKPYLAAREVLFEHVPESLKHVIIEAFRDKSVALQLMTEAAEESMHPSKIMEYLSRAVAHRKLNLVRRWLRAGFEADADRDNRFKYIAFDKLSRAIQVMFHQRLEFDLPLGDDPDESDAINIVKFLEWRQFVLETQ